MLVEAAIVLPVTFFLLLTLIGGALYMRTYVTLNSAARSAARAGSAAGQDPTADFAILSALKRDASSLGGGQIQAISVYRTVPNTEPPAACRIGPSSELKCNFYTAATLGTLLEANFGGAPSQRDSYWKASDRRVGRTDPPDYIGVYIRADAGALRLFGQPFIERWVSVRMEPIYE